MGSRIWNSGLNRRVKNDAVGAFGSHEESSSNRRHFTALLSVEMSGNIEFQVSESPLFPLLVNIGRRVLLGLCELCSRLLHQCSPEGEDHLVLGRLGVGDT